MLVSSRSPTPALLLVLKGDLKRWSTVALSVKAGGGDGLIGSTIGPGGSAILSTSSASC